MDEQVDHEWNQADNDRSKEGALPTIDDKTYPDLLADPGREPQQESINHQHEQAYGQEDEGTGKQTQDGTDKNINQAHHYRHDSKSQPGGGSMYRHEVVGW